LKTGYPLVGENYFYDEYKKIWMGSLDGKSKKI
jgi:hypothetical protein